MTNKQPLTFFREITTVPRDSGDEKRIGEYLLTFAKERGLAAQRDDLWNVIIRKSGTAGYETAPTVVLQSHTDMVYIKSEDSTHDYNSPLVLVEKDGLLKAEGTSLGADNGMGIAYALALLDSTQLSHPPLEALFTTGEETGLQGVAGLSPQAITGRRLINLDSECEGTFTVGCAGGLRAILTKPITRQIAPAEYKCFTITINGLKGGHSGIEIGAGRGNAIRLLARVLQEATEKLGALIGGLDGGEKMNAIPSSAQAVILVEDEAALDVLIQECGQAFQEELSGSDKEVALHKAPCTYQGQVLSVTDARQMLLLLLNLPNGVQSMSMHLAGLVESSNNIGVVNCEQDRVTVTCALRSSVASLKHLMRTQIEMLARSVSAEADFQSDYPHWSYQPVSPLRDKGVEVYTRLYGQEPEIVAIHAGLECGYLKSLYLDMDMISTGPNIKGAHTPLETLDLASAQRVWQWLVKLVAELKS